MFQQLCMCFSITYTCSIEEASEKRRKKSILRENKANLYFHFDTDRKWIAKKETWHVLKLVLLCALIHAHTSTTHNKKQKRSKKQCREKNQKDVRKEVFWDDRKACAAQREKQKRKKIIQKFSCSSKKNVLFRSFSSHETFFFVAEPRCLVLATYTTHKLLWYNLYYALHNAHRYLCVFFIIILLTSCNITGSISYLWWTPSTFHSIKFITWFLCDYIRFVLWQNIIFEKALHILFVSTETKCIAQLCKNDSFPVVCQLKVFRKLFAFIDARHDLYLFNLVFCCGKFISSGSDRPVVLRIVDGLQSIWDPRGYQPRSQLHEFFFPQLLKVKGIIVTTWQLLNAYISLL